MANIEQANDSDNKLLESVMNKEKYEILKSYDIKVALFYKYGKRDKEGNLKTTALSKNGVPIPAQTKIVSSFNRMTDNTDVKIILNKEVWDDLNANERESVLDNCLNYIEIKEDKRGEPIMISYDSDKVDLKLKKPDLKVRILTNGLFLTQPKCLKLLDHKNNGIGGKCQHTR